MKLRAAWRVPYTEPELAVLAAEVDACAARGVTFAYAISPGLDMVFSSDADVAHLKKKLLQVWGCLWRRALVWGMFGWAHARSGRWWEWLPLV